MVRSVKKASAKKELVSGKHAFGSVVPESRPILASAIRTSPPSLPLAGNISWQQKRDRLRQHLAPNTGDGFSQEELDAHFDGMPPRYWEKVDESELLWGLRNIHRFLYGIVAGPNADTPVVVSWRYFPEDGYTKVHICTWDRLGLLAKVAGYASALHMNIVRAEVYTRADHLVLDSFWLCNAEQQNASDADRLRQFVFLLEGGLNESPSFASTWALETHKFLPRTKRIVPAVEFNNVDSPEQTIMTVEASERPGLLYDVLQVLTDYRLNISEAVINTVEETAHDVFFLTDEHKKKVLAEAQLKEVERAIIEAVM